MSSPNSVRLPCVEGASHYPPTPLANLVSVRARGRQGARCALAVS